MGAGVMDTATVSRQLDDRPLPSTTDEAVDFLAKWYGASTRTVITIHPDTTETRRRDFEPQDEAAMRACIEATQGQLNVYFVPNACAPGRSTPNKQEMTGGRCLHLDADLKDFGCSAEELLARIKSFVPPPSAIVFTGGGYQAAWLYDGTFTGEDWVHRIESANAAIARSVGAAPGCQNVNRLLRLPGTINMLNAAKRKAGRQPALAYLVEANWGLRWSYAQPVPRLPEGAAPNGHDPGGQGRAYESGDINDLPVAWQKLIRSGDASDYGGDRSRLVLAVAIRLVRRGWSDDQIAALLLRRDLGVSAHVYDQGDAPKCAARQVSRAHELIDDECERDAAELNREYAVVLANNKTSILREFRDHKDEPQWMLMRPGDFYLWKADCDKLAKRWIVSPKRRQYKGIVFAPKSTPLGWYNIWRGFAVEPRPGDCSLFLSHIKDNVCRGDRGHYHWIVGWFSHIIQHPQEKTGTSLVLRGEQGVGKTIVFEQVGSLLGPHYIKVASPRYITGTFNAHMKGLLLLFADEAFWAGDHTAEGVLRDLVTSTQHLVEFKHIDSVKLDNFIRMGIAGPKNWLVPAGMKERRFATFDVGDAHAQDKPYFKAICEQMDNGGREALLHHLLNFDLSTVDLRTIPTTEALFEQKAASMNDIERWWLDILQNGELPGGCAGESQCSKRSLHRSYIRHGRLHNDRARRSIETQVGRFLKDNVPLGMLQERKDLCQYAGEFQKLERTYIFPPLAECRAHFEAKVGQRITWSDEDPELMGPPVAAWEIAGENVAAEWEKTEVLDDWNDGKVE
jgi:hypothetical protein